MTLVLERKDYGYLYHCCHVRQENRLKKRGNDRWQGLQQGQVRAALNIDSGISQSRVFARAGSREWRGKKPVVF